MACTSKHPKYDVPTDAEGKARYESALKHVEWAKAHGKSSDEIHEIFHKVMAGEGKHSCTK